MGIIFCTSIVIVYFSLVTQSFKSSKALPFFNTSSNHQIKVLAITTIKELNESIYFIIIPYLFYDVKNDASNFYVIMFAGDLLNNISLPYFKYYVKYLLC